MTGLINPRFGIQRFLAQNTGAIGWRLLGGNNRVLACSTVSYRDPEACAEAVLAGQKLIASSTARTTRVPVNRWSWEVQIDEAPFAAAGHAFDRMIRCEQSLSLFRLHFATATLNDSILDGTSRRWQRAGTVQVASRLLGGGDLGERRSLAPPLSSSRVTSGRTTQPTGQERRPA